MAVQRLYGLATTPDQATLRQMAEAWRPYRMWATVLLHVWLRREGGGPPRKEQPAARRRPDGTCPTCKRRQHDRLAAFSIASL